jgi:hypothetical protein
VGRPPAHEVLVRRPLDALELGGVLMCIAFAWDFEETSVMRYVST